MSLYESDWALFTQSNSSDYTLHQQTLENVQSEKYLGIAITENMNWGQHKSDISFKATKNGLRFPSGTWLSYLEVLRRIHTKREYM